MIELDRRDGALTNVGAAPSAGFGEKLDPNFEIRVLHALWHEVDAFRFEVIGLTRFNKRKAPHPARSFAAHHPLPATRGEGSNRRVSLIPRSASSLPRHSPWRSRACRHSAPSAPPS